MAACFEESNIFCFVGKGSCKWKIGLNFETNLPSEFGNLSICLLDSRCSVLGRFLVEENQSSDKKEKLHWAKLWTPIKWICMFICINLSLTYPSWRLGCQFGLRKRKPEHTRTTASKKWKHESTRRNMVWKWKLSLTTRQQQKHTRTCHPHVMGLIWWHFLTALMVNHDMDSFLSVTPATEVEAPVQSTCFCVSFRMFIFEKKHFFLVRPAPPLLHTLLFENTNLIWKHHFTWKWLQGEMIYILNSEQIHLWMCQITYIVQLSRFGCKAEGHGKHIVHDASGA